MIMNKLYSRKAIAAIIAVSFLSGSIPAYAANLVPPGIIQYIEGFFLQHISDFYMDVLQNGNDAVADNKEVLESYVDASKDRVLQGAQDYLDAEGGRIDTELNIYTNELLGSLDPLFDEQEERLKGIISDLTNSQIQQSKDQIRDALYAELNRIYRDTYE